jgi:hypothetical protein
MRKKAFVLIIALLLVFGLAACQDVTTTTTTTSGTTTATTTSTTGTTTGTTTTTSTGTTTTTAAFSISITGTADAGFTPEDVIYANTWFDLLAGVSAMGSDGVDYKDRISFEASDAACQINEEGQLMSTGPKVCVIQYTVVVNLKVARVNRTIKISGAQSTVEFTLVPDAIDNEALLGTDKVATTDDGGLNGWHYWAESAGVLGTTGFVKVENDKLIIKQETVGGVAYALQVISLTNTELVKNQMYKITMTITSTTARYIDIVTKAPNNNYAADTHSIIDISVGTAVYEMIFTANQTALHFNIMTGTVEGTTNDGAGTLEFSDFQLYAGPINYVYEELPGFFQNDDIAVGSEMEYITGTDTDYVREFYYWDQASGNILAGETVEGGIAVEVLQNPTDTWGAQLQWNDINKVGTPLIVGAHYKLTMSINSPVSRTLRIEITGRSNGLAISKGQDYSLNVGDNEIVLEFESKYDYFFMKMLFGNYGDPTQIGVYTITDLKLFVEEGAEEPVDPVDPGAIIGNVFGTPINVNNTALGIEGTDIGTETNPALANTWYLWVGQEAMGWTSYWTEFPELTSNYNAGKVTLDIAKVGAPEFWGIQLKYKGGAIVSGVTYALTFQLYSEVAREIQFEVKNDAFNVVYSAFELELVAGNNFVEVEFVAADTTLNLQFNLGNFVADPLVIEDGILEFSSFVLSRPTAEVEGLFDNGDFATDQAFGAADAAGWAYWTTTGATWLGENDVEYQGSATIANGVLTAITTQTGHTTWAAQIQYNHAGTEKLTVGAVYQVEFDVNASVATTIVAQLVTAGNFANQDVVVKLNQGDNHVSVFFVAQQADFRFFLLVGSAAPSTLVFDNVSFFEPLLPVEPEDVKALVPDGIFNGDFNTVGFEIGAVGSGWAKWTTVGESSWTKAIDATFSVVDGAVVVEIIDDAVNHGVGDHVWSIQFQYRPGTLAAPVVPGVTYIVEFDVHASVGGVFSMELTTTGNAANVPFEVTLVAGHNHVVVEYVAYEAQLMLTASIGKYGPATLTFDNFELYAMLPEEEVEIIATPIPNGIFNGDFNVNGFAVGGVDSGWSKWTTVGESSWTKAIDANFSVVDGAVVVEIIDDAVNHGVGDHVWSIQLQYRPGTLAPVVIPGKLYRVEFDVHASVAGTFSMEMTTTGNVANVAIPVTLVEGANHVVVEYVAHEAQFMLTASIGKYGPATLTFDNFVLSKSFRPRLCRNRLPWSMRLTAKATKSTPTCTGKKMA